LGMLFVCFPLTLGQGFALFPSSPWDRIP
jgi:hypothetical protein